MEQSRKITKIYLVRHGTTAWNQALRYQGQTDNPLDEIGERQGGCLEEYFKDIHVDLGVTSPLQRAVRTMEYCLATQDHEVPVLVEPGVMEIDFGTIDGWTKEEIGEKYPEYYRMYVLDEDRSHARAPGGETMMEVYDRVTNAILRIAREHRGETIVVASHGTAIQTFLNFAEGIPSDRMKRFVMYNVSVSLVELDEEDRPTLIYEGDKHHVPEELQFSYSQKRRNDSAVTSGRSAETADNGAVTSGHSAETADNGAVTSGRSAEIADNGAVTGGHSAETADNGAVTSGHSAEIADS